MSICKSLIEVMMKGKIELDSAPKVGTTAWFTVTFDKANANATPGDPRAESLSRRPSDHANLREPSPNPYLDLTTIPKDQIRVCIAEDNAINQKIAIQYVQRLGYSHVKAYDNGLKAVEGLRQMAKEGQPYHVVLMDVQASFRTVPAMHVFVRLTLCATDAGDGRIQCHQVDPSGPNRRGAQDPGHRHDSERHPG